VPQFVRLSSGITPRRETSRIYAFISCSFLYPSNMMSLHASFGLEIFDLWQVTAGIYIIRSRVIFEVRLKAI
jgi:hypothetical protein